MAEIVNLNQARKARQRAEAERQAAENRVRFGRTKAEKKTDTQEKQRGERELDGKKVE